MQLDLFKNDRQLNAETIKKQRGYFVVEHNDLITKAKHDLTSKELKIMDFIISKIKPEDTQFYTVNTSLYELNKVMELNTRSGKNYSNMADSLERMMKKVVHIFKDDNKIIMTHWLQTVRVYENGYIELLLSKDLMPYLLNLRKDYTQYYLHDTVKLDSKYSIILYKLMREADKARGQITPAFKISIEELADLLTAPKSYTFGQLNQNVLTPAVKEINQKIDDMDIHVTQIRRGRKVVSLTFYNYFYPRKLENKQKVPLINWVKDLQ